MPNSPHREQSSATLLRSRAEEQLQREPQELASMSPEQMQAVIHELHVHQIELEMQNEHLRATQEELEASRERYVELYEFAPAGYLTLNEKGVILTCNLTSVKLLGMERSQILTKAITHFVVRADQDTFYHYWRKILDGTGANVCEVRLWHMGGSEFHARLETVRAVEAGEPVFRLSLSDITEQKRAEEALRENERRRLQYENEERMRLALEAGELGAWDQDLLTGKIVCSERARAMMGYASAETITWESFLARLHPEDRSAFLAEVARSFEPSGPGRFDAVFRLVPPDGAARWLRFVARSFFDPGPPTRAVRRTGIIADITRQKEAEELLQSRAQHLDVLVRERTAQLQEAVGELEHFSYTLVHDLRAPLRAIRGFSQLLLEESDGLSPAHRQLLERSNIAAGRMDQLITDALDYNKLVRQEFVLTPVDCAALLDQLLESYPQFKEAKAQIHIHGPIPPVLGNPALLTQCFSNLLNNALKFVPPGKNPAVRICAQDKGRQVRLWFEDNGIGIAPEAQAKLFRMFERLNVTYEGTGIGLALVKKAAERMRGAVGVESEPGQGSRFWIELNKPDSQQ